MKKALTTVLIIFALVTLLADPITASDAVLSGLKNSALHVIPSIFPFMVLSDVIILFYGRQKDTKSPIFKKISLVLIGNLAGFPVGVKNCSVLCENKEITPGEALTLSILSSNASLSFVVSFVGISLFSSRKIGIILYASQILASILTAMLSFAFNCRKKEKFIVGKTNRDAVYQKEYTVEEAFVGAVSNAALSTVTVTAFITVFRVIINYVTKFITLFTSSPVAFALVSSILEISNGCVASSTVEMPHSLTICSLAIGFTGLSVMCQSFTFMKKSKISSKAFLFLKFIQGILSSVITFLLIKFITVDAETSVTLQGEYYPSSTLSFAVLILIFSWCLLKLKNLLLKLLNTKERS